MADEVREGGNGWEAKVDFRVRVRGESFVMNRVGSITGEIWVSIADYEFPGPGWHDFPVVILGWWLDGIEKLLRGRADKAVCSFMDGDYSFDLVPLDQQALRVHLYRDSFARGNCMREATAEVNSVSRTILDAARTVLEVCVSRRWSGRDVGLLRSRYSEVSKSII